MSMSGLKGKGSIVFIHPDLGIGGAERLVVDAAVGLKNLGHQVTIFTSHCDPAHCFDEARDGTLDVRVRGSSPIPPHLLGRFSILCAILRQLHLLLQISLSGELSALQPTAFFIDQLSACIPLLRILRPDVRILFYVHFPDKLLASRRSWVKRIYRVPFDWLEAWTTGGADSLVVNSEFTRGVFGKAFPALGGRRARVVYPCVDTKSGDKAGPEERETQAELWKGKKVILSINRFEKKKGIELAIRAFAGLTEKRRQGVRLVIAGGYDSRVPENVSYHSFLLSLAESLGLRCATTRTIVTALNVPSHVEVLFLLSVPATLKSLLLRSARLVVYTPPNEHFGIVPLEAMLAGAPVLASNTGGPLETVVEGKTGWLRPVDDVQKWTDVMDVAANQLADSELARMSEAGRERVRKNFSEGIMAQRLDEEISRMRRLPRHHPSTSGGLTALAGLVGVASVLMAVGAWAVLGWWQHVR